MARTVLVIEDEENLRETIRHNLEREGFDARTAADGEAGLEAALSVRPDVVVLDLMLPQLDGLEVCRALRRRSNVPILMLTAKGEEIDKVVGLELGADDYVTKPVGMRELMARVRALLRRPHEASAGAKSAEVLRSGDLEVDRAAHVVRKAGAPIEVRPREFDLLALLVSNPGRAYTREQILSSLWGHNYVGDERTVDVHVRWLREKIEDNPAQPKRIVTLRGVGYRFDG